MFLFSGGYKLPAKYIIHTVGPIGENESKLHGCYLTCLETAKALRMRHVAFPCISTGVYGYPNKNAAHVALSTAREWLEKEENAKEVSLIEHRRTPNNRRASRRRLTRLPSRLSKDYYSNDYRKLPPTTLSSPWWNCPPDKAVAVVLEERLPSFA